MSGAVGALLAVILIGGFVGSLDGAMRLRDEERRMARLLDAYNYLASGGAPAGDRAVARP